jgi:hypothetical protein
MKKPTPKIEMTPEKAAAIAKYRAQVSPDSEDFKRQVGQTFRQAILAKIPHTLRHLLPKSIG